MSNEGVIKAAQHVGDRIRKLREEQGHSQIEVAREIELSQAYVSRIESHEATPSRDVLERLAVFFGIPLQKLVEGTTSVGALDQGGPAKLYAYCPNPLCPGAVYHWINDDGPIERTVKELESRRLGGERGFVGYPEDWRMPTVGAKKLWEREDLEIGYRWVQLDENTKFCEQCGTKLRNTCPHCEVPLKMRNQRFCHRCGRQLNKPSEQPKSAGTTGVRDDD